MNDKKLSVGLAQIAPVWLDRQATLAKITDWIGRAGKEGCQLVVFGEALVPGYPFWVERTDGARFESAVQKSLFAHYVEEAVCIEAGELDSVRSPSTSVLWSAQRIAVDTACTQAWCMSIRAGKSAPCTAS